MKTLIAIPCMDQVAAPFAQSLATMQKEGDCMIAMVIGSLIYESRNNLANQALKLGCDAIMWLDSDMIFPQDTIPKMLRHLEEGKEIVSGIYYRRRPPYSPVLFSKLEIQEGKSSWAGMDRYPQDRLFEVAACGFGCVMTKTSLFWEIGVDNGAQWFTPLLGFGEDLSFCKRATNYGHKIWVDPSIQCGHVGQIIVDQSVYQAQLAQEGEANA